MATAKKPTKQQIAQAKARAGGNNPVKVTNAGLKKLGQTALIAASFTPVGRVARGAATAAKAIKAEATMTKAGWNTAAKVNYRAQVKREAAANTRGLKAAQKTTRASKSNEVKMVNKLAETNRGMGQKNPDAVRNAARVYDQIRATQTRAAARNAAAKTKKK